MHGGSGIVIKFFITAKINVSGGGEGGDSHIKMTGVVVGHSQKTPWKETESRLIGVSQIYFYHSEAPILNNTIHIMSCFVGSIA